MPDDLRRCWPGCCMFVNSQPVPLQEYENAVQRNKPGFGLPGPTEMLLPCRRIDDPVLKAAQAECGFFPGHGMKRAFGAVMPDGNMPSLFDRDGKVLRVATKEDMDKWRTAWNKAVSEGIERKKATGQA